MTKVTFLSSDGLAKTVDARDGSSLMRAAVTHDIPGIDAVCGGDLACATCHVYVESDLSRLPPPSLLEQKILRYVRDPQPNSRLSCAISITPDLQGLTVRTPTRQY